MGRVGKPHGLDGFFHVTQPSPRLPGVGAPIRVGASDTEIVGRKGTDAAPLLRVSIADSREAVEALRGADLAIDRGAAGALDADEYWADDLVGCVVSASERELGTVERMVAYPSCDVLVVGERLIPMVRDAIRSVDIEARRIEVDPEFLGL